MLLPLALLHAAQAALPGTHPVTSWDETLYSDDAGVVWVRVHYPAEGDWWGADADPSGGPYPVVAFMHGALGQAWMYEDASAHIASMGFVVLTIDTEIGPWIDTDRLARDGHAALEWMQARSDDPEHWLHGMASDGDWIAMGHSMGGVAMARLVDLEPRVTTVVGFMPYIPEGDEFEVMGSFGGAALYFSGSEDDTSTPQGVQDWLDSLGAAERGLLYELEGGGHQAITDFEWGQESMDDALQRERVLDLTTHFLLAEVFGQQDAYGALLCEVPEDSEARSSSDLPVTWVRPEDERALQLGLAERAGTEAVIYAGPGPGESETEHGRLGLRDAAEIGRASLSEGVACASASLPASLAGSGWIQVAFDGADGVTLGEVIDVFGVGDPGGEGEEGDTGDDALDPGAPTDPESKGAIGRCSAAPGSAGLGAALLALLLSLATRRRGQ